MAATIDQLNAQLDTLRNAVATGILSVQYNDRRVEYRSILEIQTAIGIVEEQIADLGGVTPIRSFKFRTSKGL